MKIRVIVLFLLLSAASTYAQRGEEIYRTYCAGCHGARLEGNTAGSLNKTEWKYGREHGSIFRNIKFGIPSTEMIAWGSVLNDDDIRAVADFIVAAQQVPLSAVREIPELITTRHYVLRVERIVEDGIRTPWSIEFIDSHHAIIAERDGRIRLLNDGKLDPVAVRGTPKTYNKRTGGYMDIALDPHYARNGWIYLSYSCAKNESDAEDAPGMTRLVRGRLRGYDWTDEQILFDAVDSLLVAGGNRWGCRLLFDRDGYLFFSIGDMARGPDSQNLGRATGKVFRINADGTIPKDNPFVGRGDALPGIFTFGNRNVQGISQHPVTGAIWATEHGPMGGDELNILKKGRNYGWPVITYGVDYDGEIVSDKTHMEGMEQPVTQWTPSIAVCPAEFNISPLFPTWKKNLLVGALAYEELRRLVINDENQITEQEMIFKGYGRVRDVKTGPDGALYVVLNSPDMILRITPEK